LPPAPAPIAAHAGYHRLFAHRAYKATPLLRTLLMLAGSGAVEGSVRWWSRDHRAHHK
jgi:stearoyl-CoA desaturase (delta-9 desaturase)